MADADHIPATKACKSCGIEKPLHTDYFSPQKLGKYGFTSKCRDCRKAQCAVARERPDQKARQQAWRDANKEYARRYNKKYREDGHKSTEATRRWYWSNLDVARKRSREKAARNRAQYPETYRAIARRYAEKNADRVRARSAANSMRKYREVPWFNLRIKVASRMRRMLIGCGGKSRRRTEELLGYSAEQLVTHLQRQFTKGMTWGALLRGEIEVDHIIPVAKFRVVSHDDPEFRACWALSNLRPMWTLDNRKKSHKVLTLL